MTYPNKLPLLRSYQLKLRDGSHEQLRATHYEWDSNLPEGDYFINFYEDSRVVFTVALREVVFIRTGGTDATAASG